MARNLNGQKAEDGMVHDRGRGRVRVKGRDPRNRGTEKIVVEGTDLGAKQGSREVQNVSKKNFVNPPKKLGNSICYIRIRAQSVKVAAQSPQLNITRKSSTPSWAQISAFNGKSWRER
jgi:hypothetical protein